MNNDITCFFKKHMLCYLLVYLSKGTEIDNHKIFFKLNFYISYLIYYFCVVGGKLKEV